MTFFPAYPLAWASHWASGTRSQLASQRWTCRGQPPGSRAGQMTSENISPEQNKVGNGNRERSARRTNPSFQTLKLEKWSWVWRGKGARLRREGCMYTWSWFTLLYGRDQHNIVEQLSSHYKFKRRERERDGQLFLELVWCFSPGEAKTKSRGIAWSSVIPVASPCQGWQQCTLVWQPGPRFLPHLPSQSSWTWGQGEQKFKDYNSCLFKFSSRRNLV